jgi:DNA-binding MarR family transcriptional regulator
MLDVLKRFRVLLRAMDTHYRQVEGRSGLGGAQLWALSEIDADRGLTVGDLAGRLAVHVSTASNLVSRLVELGLVARSRGAGDSRIVRLRATSAGRGRLRAAPKPTAGLLQDALLGMESDDLRALKVHLDSLLRRMGKQDRKGSQIPLGQMLGRPIKGE